MAAPTYGCGHSQGPQGQRPGAKWDLGRIVAELRAERERWRERQQRHKDVGGRELPSREVLQEIVTQLQGALFPMRLGPAQLHQETEDYYIGYTLDAALEALLGQVRLELCYAARHQPALRPDLALVEPLHPGGDAQERGFAAAGGPEQAGDLPRREVERHAVKRRDPVIGLADPRHRQPDLGRRAVPPVHAAPLPKQNHQDNPG